MPSEAGFGFQTASVLQKCYNPLFTGTSVSTHRTTHKAPPYVPS
ncbi:TPA: hypothetical protein ACFP4U_000344 [Neisseria lactamica]|nr:MULTISPECIES: exodeoxyribonuclease VII [Neisseria]MCL6067321.1 exodeoxyribonuclease VII [Neisseria meningitidis]